MQVSDLQERDGWVVFKYPDGSVRFFRTTFNAEILQSLPKIEEGKLFDLDKLRWVDFPSNPDVELEVHAERPQLDKLHEFLNMYI